MRNQIHDHLHNFCKLQPVPLNIITLKPCMQIKGNCHYDFGHTVAWNISLLSHGWPAAITAVNWLLFLLWNEISPFHVNPSVPETYHSSCNSLEPSPRRGALALLNASEDGSTADCMGIASVGPKNVSHVFLPRELCVHGLKKHLYLEIKPNWYSTSWTRGEKTYWTCMADVVANYDTAWTSKTEYIHLDQWEFQDPKMEVPTIYKAYIRPM